jgi:flagellar biosynthesis/type III secretory pathway protein FliH
MVRDIMCVIRKDQTDRQVLETTGKNESMTRAVMQDDMQEHKDKQRGRRLANKVRNMIVDQSSEREGSQAGMEAGRQVGRQVGRQEGRQAGRQAGRKAGKQSGKQASRQTGTDSLAKVNDVGRHAEREGGGVASNREVAGRQAGSQEACEQEVRHASRQTGSQVI